MKEEAILDALHGLACHLFFGGPTDPSVTRAD